MEVSPVVQAPEEGVQVVRREPQGVARSDAVRVEAVGRVVDAPGGQRLLVHQAQAESVQASELARQEIAASVEYENHAAGVRAIEDRRTIPHRWARSRRQAQLEPVALAPAERVKYRGLEDRRKAGDRGRGQAHGRL
jgi:hypothetical protein